MWTSESSPFAACPVRMAGKSPSTMPRSSSLPEWSPFPVEQEAAPRTPHPKTSGKESVTVSACNGLLVSVYNDGEISTCGWIIEVHSVQYTMMGRSQHVGGL